VVAAGGEAAGELDPALAEREVGEVVVVVGKKVEADAGAGEGVAKAELVEGEGEFVAQAALDRGDGAEGVEGAADQAGGAGPFLEGGGAVGQAGEADDPGGGAAGGWRGRRGRFAGCRRSRVASR
jgi:hypothetical protein